MLIAERVLTVHGGTSMATCLRPGCHSAGAPAPAVPEDSATREAAKAAALSWASKHTYNTMGVAVPKALADVVEALIGAVYLDSNCNDERTWQVSLIPSTAG